MEKDEILEQAILELENKISRIRGEFAVANNSLEHNNMSLILTSLSHIEVAARQGREIAREACYHIIRTSNEEINDNGNDMGDGG